MVHVIVTSTTNLSIFLHECPEVQDVYTTLTGSLDARLGVLPRCRVVAIEGTSWTRHEGALVIFVECEKWPYRNKSREKL